mgnify:CR=1 FL=1
MVNRRLNSKGRNLTLRMRGGYSDSDNKSFDISDVNYFLQRKPGGGYDRSYMHQYNVNPSKSYNGSADLSYSEPCLPGRICSSATVTSTVIPTPTDRVICMTTPQLAGFTGLNAYDKVVATSTTRRMQNKEWLARLKDGRVKKIGMEGNFDTEIIIASQPDIIFVSPTAGEGMK